MGSKFYKYTGIAVTVLAVITLESMKMVDKISTIIAFLGMITVFSISVGGLASGVCSIVITLCYLYYLNETRALNPDFYMFPNYEIILSIVSMLCIVIIVSIMAYKYRNYNKKFRDSQLYVSRAEDISVIMIEHTSVDGRYIKVPEKLCTLLDYTEHELLDMYYWEIGYPEDMLIEEKLTSEIISGKRETYNIQKRLYKKNREIVWIFCNVSAVKNHNGEILYLLRYGLDITEQKRMEEEKKTQLNFLHKLIDALPNPIFISDISGRNISFNKTFTDYIGYDCSNINYKDLLTLLKEDDADELIESCKRAINDNEIQEHDLIIRSPQGVNRHAIINIAPYTDVNEVVAGIIISITDITNIKNMENELRHNQDKYRNLVELDPDTVLIHEGDTISFINNAGIKLLGASKPEEIIGESIDRFIHLDCIRVVKSYIEKACSNLNYFSSPFELKMMSIDGKHIDAEAVNVGFTNGNGALVMAIIRDISERKISEELKVAMKENERRLLEAIEYDRIKNEFFANISHEFRTPLNVILGTLQLLNIHSKNNNNNNMDKYLGIMKQNCYRLLRLVSNLIDITKIDAGFFDINIGCCDIVSIVEGITLSITDYTQEKGLTLEFDTDVKEKYINCDPDQIERIILNLISNAIKFTKPGGKINVNLNDNSSSITIRVKDTGIGIPEDRHKVIFERFRQIDKSLTRDHEGSGIGLSLVKSLVEMHRGTISLISQPGSGSEFIVEIPVGQKAGCHNEELAVAVAEDGHIERIKIEFSDIYS